MTIGSLFSGIGGLELGLEMCGLGPVLWQAEQDPYALAVLAQHWPETRRYTDVREVDERAARVDVVCGGFPCQPHSLAGKRRGTSDDRWLWPEFARVIAAVRPSVVFVENVPGLRGSGLRNVLADLAVLGFDAEWSCFSAADVGAPHLRKRLFVFAYSNGKSRRIQQKSRSRADSAITRHDGSDEHVASAESRDGETVSTGVASRCSNPWETEPDVGRVADGVPARTHRLRLLGNAVVPQQVALAWRELTARAA